MSNQQSVNGVPASRGADRLLSKLKQLKEKKEFYEAHQIYRTLNFRYSSAKRFTDLRSLLLEGANWFLDHQEFNSGADVASLYLTTLNEDPNKASVFLDPQIMKQVSQNIGSLFSKIPSKCPERMQFTLLALKLDPETFNIPLIHHSLAMVLWLEKNYSEARYHFLRSNCEAGQDAATFLVEYQVSENPAEVDLFISKFILQLLCVKSHVPILTSESSPRISPRYTMAKTIFRNFLINHPRIKKESPPFNLPLLDFIWGLLEFIPSGDSSKFLSLCEEYATEISRDPEYKKHLSRVGEIYFGLRSASRPQGMGGLLGNILQSMMEDSDDDFQDARTDNNQTTPVTGDRPSQRVAQDDDDLD